MSSLDQGRQTHRKNILTKIDKTMPQVRALVEKCGLTKHGELRQMFIDEFGLSYGDANGLVHYALESDAQSAAEAANASMDEILAGIYIKSKSPLLPLHVAVMEKIQQLGEFEIAPKKTYLSLRRKRQFAMVGPASKGRLEIGLNMKGLAATDRLTAQKPGGMCQYKVTLTTPEEIDAELLGWLQTAYENAG